ncbi:ribosome-recycling factor, mitochondrial [Venturia canescens]|uniref:ribosome-recycling factor, mitochondrial n=1 Tax=Venturia canescens TaxID=32260 RepID=UPI001C9C3BB5|nr:ribosome-recycling factor, mitochondrial [Venturia canescens]
MRGIALMWTKNLNKNLINRAIMENYGVRNRIANFQSFPCQLSHIMKHDQQSNNFLNVNKRNFTTTQILLKSKDKERKKNPGKVHVDLNELAQFIDVEKLTSNFESSVADLKSNYVKHLTLRSTTGSIEQIPVPFDGQEYLLEELVEIARKPKMVVLNVACFPQAIPDILNAISKSGLNLNPQQDGTTIFIPIPKVTKEHRESLSKNAKVLFLKCRDGIKDTRSKEINNLKKSPSLSEDAVRRVQTQIEALSEQFIKDAEKIFETKQKELLGLSD